MTANISGDLMTLVGIGYIPPVAHVGYTDPADSFSFTALKQ